MSLSHLFSEIALLTSMRKVYSPHTAVDAAPGGLGDWLADIVTGTLSKPEPATKTAEVPEPITDDTDSSSSEVKAKEPEDPFLEKDVDQKTPRQQLQRMSLARSYSRPTYPEHKEQEQIDLAP